MTIMDWRRAKTILILVFIALNLVLTVTLYRNVKGGEISQQTRVNTQRILEQNNVHIECPIPTYVGKDYILQYDETIIDKNKIITGLLEDNYSKISDNIYKKDSQRLEFTSESGFEYTDGGGSRKIYGNSKSQIDSNIKELAKKLGIPFNEFKLDEFDTPDSGKGSRSVYKGTYKDYSVFDNYIEVEVENSGLKSIRYHYKKPMTITNRDINVIPVYQILITRMTNYPGITIKGVDIGFKGITVDKDTKTLYEGLSWRIKTTTEGEEFYFNATNGQQME